jgi:hypothetical protein
MPHSYLSWPNCLHSLALTTFRATTPLEILHLLCFTYTIIETSRTIPLRTRNSGDDETQISQTQLCSKYHLSARPANCLQGYGFGYLESFVGRVGRGLTRLVRHDMALPNPEKTQNLVLDSWLWITSLDCDQLHGT